jgi:tellurite resistance protein TehA-like permease
MHGGLRLQIARLNPGYDACVMATAIVSSGFGLVHRRVLSDLLLVIAAGAFVMLLVAYAWRLVAYRAQMLADARDPSRAFGYFTVVAAANVLADRLSATHRSPATVVLGAASLPVWVLLTYGILGAMVLGRRGGPVLPGVNGSWFLLVVATQSLAVTAATVAASTPDLAPSLAPVAVALWGIGVLLYLLVAALVTIHVLELSAAPHALSPTYWIYMGASAITVLAAARILRLPDAIPVIVATREVVSGIAFLLWAFASWWIPLLLVFAVWRSAVLRERLHYDATWWSMVFPLGMYAVASAAYGRATGMGFMVDVGRVEVWLGFAAWLGVAGAMLASLVDGSPEPTR